MDEWKKVSSRLESRLCFLMDLLDDRCDIFCPGNVSGDEDTRKPEGVDPLYTLAVDVEAGLGWYCAS